MAHPAIILDGIGKAYQIGLRPPDEEGLGRAIKSAVTAPLRNLRRLSGRSSGEETFWALRDVSFEVPAGQVSRSVGNARGASAVRMVATAEFHSPIH